MPDSGRVLYLASPRTLTLCETAPPPDEIVGLAGLIADLLVGQAVPIEDAIVGAYRAKASGP